MSNDSHTHMPSGGNNGNDKSTKFPWKAFPEAEEIVTISIEHKPQDYQGGESKRFIGKFRGHMQKFGLKSQNLSKISELQNFVKLRFCITLTSETLLYFA